MTVLGISETPTRSPLEKIILPTKPPGTRQPAMARTSTSAQKKKLPGQTTTAKLRQDKSKKTTQSKEKQINVSTKTLKKSMLQTKTDKKATGKPSHNPKLSIKGAREIKKGKLFKPTKPKEVKKPNVWLQKAKNTGKEVKKPVKSKPKATVSKKQDGSKKTKNSPLAKKRKLFK